MERCQSNLRTRASNFAKHAATPAQQHIQQLAAERLRNVLLAGLGVGAAARGGVGLLNMMRRHHTPQSTADPAMLPAPIPLRRREEEEEKIGSIKEADFKTWLSELMSGGKATDVSGVPWFMPAAVLGGAGAAYGGYQGMDYLLDRQRKTQQEDELEEARRQFHEALMGGGEKISGDGETTLGQELDALYDDFEKLANARHTPMEKAALENTLGQMLGLYGLYGGTSALLAGLWAYDKARKSSRRAMMEKAKKQRERDRLRARPPQIYAFPEPQTAEPV
jgi:hypothetical protein